MYFFKKYFLGDVFYKSIRRFFDYFHKLYWFFVLGKIGKKSFLKAGVKIIGNPRRIEIGSDFIIWHNCILSVGEGQIEIGNKGLLGINSYLNASHGKIKIGNNVAIAPFCQIYSYSHHYYPDKSVMDSHKVGDVIIEDDVLIGCNTVILPGVTIHKGAIVAASAVVNKDVPSFSIVAGIPIKEIGKRDL
jgi:maltose O-acetyltransferase